MNLENVLPYQIVVFDDGEEGSRVPKWSEDESETSGTFLTRLLRFMETPQYLRQTLFPRHSSLGFAVCTLPFTLIKNRF